jgi:hypothetical protein
MERKVEFKKGRLVWIGFSILFIMVFLLKGVIISVLEWILRYLSIPAAVICLLIFFYPLIKVWWIKVEKKIS